MIKWILNKIVGSKNQREVRKLRPVVKNILEIEESLRGKDQDYLVGKTREWQKQLHRLTPIDLPTRGVILSSDAAQLQEYADVLNTRFDALKEDFSKLIAHVHEKVWMG